MKAKVQMFTKKGFYGKELHLEISTVAGLSEAVLKAFDKLPGRLEGESILDWTRISVEVTRS